MFRTRVLKPAKQRVVQTLRKAGYHIVANAEYERLLMRDNLAGLFARGLSASQPLSGQEREFLSMVSGFNEVTQSQLFQDLFALFVSSTRRGGYFVEVGVGDGVAHSNTRLLEASYGWSGLLIEPNFALWDAIRQTRRASLAPCAASASEGELLFHRVATPELSYVGNDVPHDDLQRPVLESRVVKTKTLDAILSEHGAPQDMDYLSIDVEGHELEVLSGFDVNRWRPKAITIEYNNDAPRAEAIRRGLPGYTQAMPSLSGCDLWFVRDRA